MSSQAVPVSADVANAKPATSAPPTTKPTDREIKRLLESYFSGRHDHDVAARRALERSSMLARVAFAALGASMIAVAVARVGVPGSMDALRQLGNFTNLALLVPGAVLIAIALYAACWSRGWPRPVALALLTVVADIYLMNLVNPLVCYAIATLAGGLLAWDVWQWIVGYQAPAAIADIEDQIDRWIEGRFQGLLEQARPDLPVPELSRSASLDTGDASSQRVTLKCFPKLDRVPPERVRVRIGTDKKPRVSPLGLAVFEFGEETVIMFEGAIDLWSQSIVYARVHQFRYGDIVALAWSSDAFPPNEKPSSPGSIVEKMRPFDSKRAAAGRKDELQIRLYGHRNVSVVMRDCAIHENIRNTPFQPIEDIAKVREVWRRLSEGKRRARALPLV